MEFNLDLRDRGRFVDALFGCDCMKTLQSRNRIVRDLPAEIQQRITAGGTARQDVDDLVLVCSAFPRGIETLLQRVGHFEGDSFAWRRLQEVIRQLQSGPSPPPPATAAPPVAEAESSFGYDVFLSHNSQDKPAVERVARRAITRATAMNAAARKNGAPGTKGQPLPPRKIAKVCVKMAGPMTPLIPMMLPLAPCSSPCRVGSTRCDMSPCMAGMNMKTSANTGTDASRIVPVGASP